MNIDDTIKRFEERQATTPEDPPVDLPPQPTDPTQPIGDAPVANEAINIELPPSIRRGMVVYEKETGQLDFLPIAGTQPLTQMDGIGMLAQATASIQAQLTAMAVAQVVKKAIKEALGQAGSKGKTVQVGRK